MVNELYKNIIQRLPAAIVLVTFIFGILYLQNIFVILALLMGIEILLIKEWLALSDSKIDLKQIIFFVILIIGPPCTQPSNLKIIFNLDVLWVSELILLGV